jgi:pyridoxal/pyridoxine/pyridoxamine kinase
LIVIDPVLGGTGSKMVVPFQMDYAYPEEYDKSPI